MDHDEALDYAEDSMHAATTAARGGAIEAAELYVKLAHGWMDLAARLPPSFDLDLDPVDPDPAAAATPVDPS